MHLKKNGLQHNLGVQKDPFTKCDGKPKVS